VPRFTEAAGDFGLDLVDACLMSAFCDYDRDGDLDVLVSDMAGTTQYRSKVTMGDTLFCAGLRPRTGADRRSP
jgi:hypothetical protein